MLGLVVDMRDLGIGLQSLTNLVLLSLSGGLLPRALRPRDAVNTQEDRDLDLVIPLALEQVDLLGGQQGRPEQGQGNPHRDDDGQGHRRIAAQPGPRLSQGVTHVFPRSVSCRGSQELR